MKVFNTIILAITLLACVSCAKVTEMDPNPDGPLIAVIADNDDPETRIAINDSNGNFTWSSGDKIAIHYSNSYADCSVSTSGVVTFSQTSATRNYYAVYPASIKDASNYGNPTLKVTLPDTYDISTQVANDDYTYSPLPMVAKNDPDETLLQFHHVGGLLRITIPAESLNTNTKTIAVTLDKGVTGSFTVSNPTTTAPSISAGTSSSTVTFTITSSTSIGTAKTVVLNLPLPLGTYNSVTITQKNSSGNALYTTVHTASFTIARAHGKKLADSAWMQYLEVTGDGLTLSGTELLSGADKILTVKSWKNTSTAVGWKAMVSTDGGNTYVDHSSSSWPSWLSLSAYSGNGGTAGERVHVYVDRNQPAGAAVADVATANGVSIGYSNYNRGDGKGMVGTLQGKGEVTGPRDLSKRNVYGSLHGSSASPSSITTAGSSTANCYVVNAPGYYCFPIVYGNAYKNNAVNSGAYSGMKNADGNNIGNAQILSDSNLAKSGPYEAVLVWQDVQPGWEMLGNDDIKVIDTPSDAGISGCKYIQFYIAKARIVPGNIVIALKDVGKNKILWSWHIWVTDTSGSGNVFSDFWNADSINHAYRSSRNTTSTAGNVYMMNVNLGWTPPLKYTKTGGTTSRSAILKFVPTSGYANPVEKTVSQPAVASSDVGIYTGTYYSCCYYQWGRKDPFLPGSGGASNKSVSAGPGFTITTGTTTLTNSNMSATPASWIKNPATFDNTSSAAGTKFWNANGDEETLAVKKTVYDPCPAGFCVPRGYVMTGATKDGGNKNVMNTVSSPKANSDVFVFYRDAITSAAQPLSFWVCRAGGTNESGDYPDRTLYMPACGHRVGSGNLDSYTSCYYWTAARVDSNGHLFLFSKSQAYPSYTYGTAHGFMVRPQREE